MTNCSLLFIDDHPLFRQGLVFALGAAMPAMAIRDVGSLEEALGVLDRHEIDLVLSDYRLEMGDGIDAIRRIRLKFPSIACGILCADITPQLSRQARECGAVALLSKNRDVPSLVEAITIVFDGGCVFDDLPDHLHLGDVRLSDRRLEILRLAAYGNSNKEIARQLNVTERTIKDHWSQILAQLSASNRTQAVSLALQYGLIE